MVVFEKDNNKASEFLVIFVFLVYF